jgi:hypothetical protein
MTLPNRPDWRKVIMEKYARKGNPNLGPLQVEVRLQFVKILDEAARRQNVTRATFIRRSCAIQMARVLGLDVRTLLLMCPSVRPWRDRSGPRPIDAHDLGEGIEQWCPHPECDGSHL